MSAGTPDATPGFRIQGTFYPDLDHEQWSNDAYTIVRRMMYPGTLSDFLMFRCDGYLYNSIRAAVCLFTARAGLMSVDEVIDLIGGLKPAEIVAEGYKMVTVEDEADPLDGEAPENTASSGSGEPSSEESPDSSRPEPSGLRLSPTGSEG